MKYLKSKSQMIRLDQLQSVNDMNSRPFTSEAKCHNIDWSYTSGKQQPGARFTFTAYTHRASPVVLALTLERNTLVPIASFTQNVSISVHTSLKIKKGFRTLGMNTASERNARGGKNESLFWKNTIEPYSVIFLINQVVFRKSPNGIHPI